MTGGRGPWCRADTGARGTVLIEVVVAVLLAGLLVGELAAGLGVAIDRAARAEAQVRSIGVESPAAGGEPWGWGPSVSWLSWEAGPVLQAGFRQRDRAEDLVAGLWADGWFLGEHYLGADAGLLMAGATWEGMRGQELVLRVREGEGEWGPPWRTVVPDVYGDIVGVKVASLAAVEQGGALSGEATAVHVPSLANPALESSWTGRPREAAGLGAPLFLVPSTPGLSDIAFAGNIQTWLKEAGRVVDLYF